MSDNPSPSLEIPSHLTIGSTKNYAHSLGLSCTFRQWRAESHCRFLHGYSLQIRFTFSSETLDHRNWVVDFGSLKSLKGWLESMFDHKTLVASDDPHFDDFMHMHKLGLMQVINVPHVGCEAMAYYIYEYAEQWLIDNGYTNTKLEKVEVWEHESNSAYCERKTT